jgi:cell division septation protein DedD
MRKLITLLLFLVSISVFPQADSSALDRMTPDELLKYYQNEKPPFSNYRGNTKIGDSLFTQLNTQVIPTETVYGPSLYRSSEDLNPGRIKLFDSLDREEQKMKPKVSLGMGRLAYYGDLYQKHFQSPLTGRMAYDLNISQRLTRYLQLNFNVLFGTLGANENLPNRHENFYSEIRAGGLNLLYDFGNFIPDGYNIRPFVSFGVMGFEFLSKTDLKDKNGNTYYYWSDGSIKDRPQNAPDAQNAKDLKRDYTYETDIRERNADGFGKYRESAWAFPVGGGFMMKVTDRIDAKLNFQLFFTTTDYIDGITSKSMGNRAGNKQNDRFSYTSFSIQYDLVALPREKSKLATDTLSDKYMLAMDNEDKDKDKVPDLKDDCQGTPEGVAVDDKGCPLDDDKDGIPNYRDDELSTPKGMPVNERGVGQTDDYWKNWYAQFMNDTLGEGAEVEYVSGPAELARKNMGLGKEKRELYTVELARYTGAIPTDELALLLSIGDIKSVTLDDGTTVVYVAGEYKKIKTAVKRRDEFRAEGNKSAVVSRIKGRNIERISEDELAQLLKKQEEADLKEAATTGTAGVNTNTATAGTNTATAGTNTATAKTNTAAATNTAATNPASEDGIVYRVQLGAFKNRISTSVFNTNAGVLELKTGESYRYVTRGFSSIEEAAAVRADLVIQGYSDAFVTAYKDGKRIPMSQTKAIVDKSYKEDLNENKTFSTVDKKLIVIRVQLGPLKKSFQEKGMDDRLSAAGVKDVEKQTTTSGSIRYFTGSFNNFDAANKYLKELQDKGFADAFVVPTFKGEIISTQEAMELLKK